MSLRRWRVVAYNDGFDSCLDGLPSSANPYDEMSDRFKAVQSTPAFQGLFEAGVFDKLWGEWTQGWLDGAKHGWRLPQSKSRLFLEGMYEYLVGVPPLRTTPVSGILGSLTGCFTMGLVGAGLGWWIAGFFGALCGWVLGLVGVRLAGSARS